MADGVVQFLLEKIVSFLEHEAPLLGGVRDEFNQIKHELEIMKSFLIDADKKRFINQGVRTWVEQVRDASFDVEDIIDKFMYYIDSQCSGSDNCLMRFFHKAIHLPKNIYVRHQMATELQSIRNEILTISNISKQFGLVRIYETTMTSHDHHDARQVQKHHGESSLFISDDDLVGIDKDKGSLLDWLMEEEPQRTIISVVGMGGSGKTTLVGRVYNSQTVKSHFACHACITVSQTYEIKDLLRSMIKEFSKPNKELASENFSTMDYGWLVEKLVSYLQQKRYLVVLDDVWDITNLWSQISVALPNSSHGSRIMITTRKEDIACFSFGVRSYVHHIQPLQQTEAWELFCKKVFSADSSRCCPQELDSLARALVKKCDGLPLAIVSLGGLMSSRDRTEREWRKVYDSLNWELDNNPELDRVKSILLHSLNDLPYYLKHCFLYCCVFPEDYLIKLKRLIRLWIAEGFVQERRGMTLEEVADTYLNDLIHRSMLQVVKKNDYGRVKECRMHDIIRELAISISEEEKFCKVLLYDGRQQETREEGKRTIRLSLIKRDETSEVGLQIHWYQLRSFFVFDNQLALNTLPSGFKLLRVLDLEEINIERVPNELADLFNLRYLNLKGRILVENRIKELPKSLGKLRKLQFLDIRRTNVKALRRSTVKLQNLQYLSLSPSLVMEGVQVPVGVCKLKKLQVLDGVNAEEGNVIREIDKMTQLTKLGIRKVRVVDERDLCASIQKLALLRNLLVRFKREEEEEEEDSKSVGGIGIAMDALTAPPPLLHKLHLSGKLAKVPHWFHCLDNLVFLRLYDSQLKEDDILSQIQALPKLQHLSLYNSYDGQQLYFRSGGFLHLKKLDLESLPQLNEVIIEQGAMPCLSYLSVSCCEELKMVPQGIEYLVNLQNLYLFGASNELLDRIRSSGEDRPRIQHIPRIERLYFDVFTGWITESL